MEGLLGCAVMATRGNDICVPEDIVASLERELLHRFEHPEDYPPFPPDKPMDDWKGWVVCVDERGWWWPYQRIEHGCYVMDITVRDAGPPTPDHDG